MTSPLRPVVTDHAVLRCLQRVFDIDVELVRAMIAETTAAGREAVAAELGTDVRFAIVRDRARYVIDGGYVVTTLPIRHRIGPTVRRRRR